MSLREEQWQCKKVCRILDDVLANRPTERDSLIVAVKKAFKALAEPHWIPVAERLPNKEKKSYWVCLENGGQCQCRWTNDIYGLGANEWSKWGWKKVDLPQYSKVVAYMPLLEPYRGG